MDLSTTPGKIISARIYERQVEGFPFMDAPLGSRNTLPFFVIEEYFRPHDAGGVQYKLPVSSEQNLIHIGPADKNAPVVLPFLISLFQSPPDDLYLSKNALSINDRPSAPVLPLDSVVHKHFLDIVRSSGDVLHIFLSKSDASSAKNSIPPYLTCSSESPTTSHANSYRQLSRSPFNQ